MQYGTTRVLFASTYTAKQERKPCIILFNQTPVYIDVIPINPNCATHSRLTLGNEILKSKCTFGHRFIH